MKATHLLIISLLYEGAFCEGSCTSNAKGLSGINKGEAIVRVANGPMVNSIKSATTDIDQCVEGCSEEPSCGALTYDHIKSFCELYEDCKDRTMRLTIYDEDVVTYIKIKTTEEIENLVKEMDAKKLKAEIERVGLDLPPIDLGKECSDPAKESTLPTTTDDYKDLSSSAPEITTSSEIPFAASKNPVDELSSASTTEVTSVTSAKPYAEPKDEATTASSSSPATEGSTTPEDESSTEMSNDVTSGSDLPSSEGSSASSTQDVSESSTGSASTIEASSSESSTSESSPYTTTTTTAISSNNTTSSSSSSTTTIATTAPTTQLLMAIVWVNGVRYDVPKDRGYANISHLVLPAGSKVSVQTFGRCRLTIRWMRTSGTPSKSDFNNVLDANDKLTDLDASKYQSIQSAIGVCSD